MTVSSLAGFSTTSVSADRAWSVPLVAPLKLAQQASPETLPESALPTWLPAARTAPEHGLPPVAPALRDALTEKAPEQGGWLGAPPRRPCQEPGYPPSVFLLLFASRPAPTMSSSEMSSSCQDRQKPALNYKVRHTKARRAGAADSRGDVPTFTPLSFRRGVLEGGTGVRFPAGLKTLGAVGLRKGACFGMPLSGARTGQRPSVVTAGLPPRVPSLLYQAQRQLCGKRLAIPLAGPRGPGVCWLLSRREP